MREAFTQRVDSSDAGLATLCCTLDGHQRGTVLGFKHGEGAVSAGAATKEREGVMIKLSKKNVTGFVATMLLATGVGLGSPSATYAESSGDAGWLPLRREDGILVSRKEIPGSPFLALRGEGNVQQPPLLVGSVLVDVAHSRDWVDSVAEARVLRWVSRNEYVAYTHVRTPVTMADREFVTDVRVDVDAAAGRVLIRVHSVDDPLAPKTHFVRGDIEESTLLLTSTNGGRSTHVVAELHADPKGGVAPWLVNMFQKNWGYNTLEGLRAQTTKHEASVVPWLRSLLTDSGYFSPTTAPKTPASG